MGTTPTTIADLLFSQTRRTVLSLLYGHSDERFYLRQIARMVGNSVSAVQREVKLLAHVGLITRTAQGNQVLYQANHNSPVFPELKSFITKTAGVRDVIREALLPFGDRIEVAFVYGSVARQQETADSDVDLMIVGKVDFGEIASALQRAQTILGREINPTVYPPSEFRQKLHSRSHFVTSVVEREKLFVIGDEGELGAMGRLARSARK